MYGLVIVCNVKLQYKPYKPYKPISHNPLQYKPLESFKSFLYYPFIIYTWYNITWPIMTSLQPTYNSYTYILEIYTDNRSTSEIKTYWVR